MRKIKIVFSEKYETLSEIIVEMTEEEYRNYYNDKVPLDSIIKHCSSREDFVKRTEKHDNPKYRILSVTDDDVAMSNLKLCDFNLEYINNE